MEINDKLIEGAVTVHGFFVDEDYDEEGLRYFIITSVNSEVCNGDITVKREWINIERDPK